MAMPQLRSRGPARSRHHENEGRAERPKWNFSDYDSAGMHGGHPLPREIRQRFRKWLTDFQRRFQSPVMFMGTTVGDLSEEAQRVLPAAVRSVVLITGVTKASGGNERHGPVAPACLGCTKESPVIPGMTVPLGWRVEPYPNESLPMKLRGRIFLAGLFCDDCSDKVRAPDLDVLAQLLSG